MNNTVRLFDENAYTKEFECTVLACIRKGELYGVITDRTAIFPGGGGQACDLGTLGNTRVLSFYSDDAVLVSQAWEYLSICSISFFRCSSSITTSVTTTRPSQGEKMRSESWIFTRRGSLKNATIKNQKTSNSNALAQSSVTLACWSIR